MPPSRRRTATKTAAPTKPPGPPIISLDEVEEGNNVAIYADPGAGKTVLAGSGDNVLFIATEQGLKAARKQGSKAKAWIIRKWDDLQDVVDWAEANPDHGFEWFAIDSATDMQQLCMRAVLDAAVAENASRDPDIPALQDWQKYYNMFTRFVKAFNALPVNVLYTATVVRHEDEEGDALVLPNIQGRGYAMASTFCAMMDFVGYLSVQRIGKGDEATIRRTILWQTTPPYIAKDRLDALGRRMLMTEQKGSGELRKVNDLKTITAKIKAASGPAPASTAAKATTRPARRRRTTA